MCELCRHRPCHARCPNADRGFPAALCGLCGEGIWPEEAAGRDEASGAGYYDIGGLLICEPCAAQRSRRALMALAGYPIRFAAAQTEDGGPL